jgi:hypothetical protein
VVCKMALELPVISGSSSTSGSSPIILALTFTILSSIYLSMRAIRATIRAAKPTAFATVVRQIT